jgi:hypothetical protein
MMARRGSILEALVLCVCESPTSSMGGLWKLELELIQTRSPYVAWHVPAAVTHES